MNKDTKAISQSSKRKGPHFSTRHDGREWKSADSKLLIRLLKESTPIQMIGLKLGRSIGSVRYHVRREQLSMKRISRNKLKNEDKNENI
jgi:hypothetical protein